MTNENISAINTLNERSKRNLESSLFLLSFSMPSIFLM